MIRGAATYLRWSLFAPSVIEPSAMAKMNGLGSKAQPSWLGRARGHARRHRVGHRGRDFLLGDQFSMADIIFGGTVRYLLRFNMLEARPSFTAYSERLAARPALARADARNAAVIDERGLRR